MSTPPRSAPGPPTDSFTTGQGAVRFSTPSTQMTAIVVAVIVAIGLVVGAFVLKSSDEPKTTAPQVPTVYQQQQEQAVACMNGGGTWNPSGISGYCSHFP
jgi:hypothetical protein